ncbi:unnamed protein product [Psylliodes chrysocephalus]|uniref:Uncharacterized protein n=1 Tax=Psylliodes chrysocephalus TaxID=3402493 RepID=A0A9P0GBN7_9CUCU|nr:unnamed protein product [Psylliodes chrysocephala]
MDSTFNIFVNPCKCNVKDDPLHLQMELIKLQEDSYLKSKFDDVELSEFYRTCLSKEKYPQLDSRGVRTGVITNQIRNRTYSVKLDNSNNVLATNRQFLVSIPVNVNTDRQEKRINISEDSDNSYSEEQDSCENLNIASPEKTTSCGRSVKPPKRLNL